MSVIYIDIETVPHDAARGWLKAVKPAANLVDASKVAADIAKKEAAQLERMALDCYACRIVALAWAVDDGPVVVTLAPDEDVEAMSLAAISRAVEGRTLVGHNIRAFDVPVIVARARLLGVPVPSVIVNALRKRWDTTILDTYEEVLLGQFRGDDSHVVGRGLVSMCRVHGIDVPDDDIDGAAVAQAVAEGRWDDIRTHVTRDVERTRALAQRLRLTTESRRTEFAGVGR